MLIWYPYEEFGVSCNLVIIFLCEKGVGGPSNSFSFFSLVTESKFYFSVNDFGWKKTFPSLCIFPLSVTMTWKQKSCMKVDKVSKS